MASAKARLSQTTAHLIPSTNAMNTISLTHPSLPKLTGVASTIESVPIAQFRGLQYGVIAKRFAPATMLRYEDAARTAGLEGREFGYVLYLSFLLCLWLPYGERDILPGF
jgi:hypothetical protein